jgi:hypothetical protein
LATPASKARSAYLDHVTPDEEGGAEVKDWAMDHSLLILALKSLGQWVVSTESPELYDRAVVVDLLKSLATDENELEEAQQIFVRCYLAVTLAKLCGTLSIIHRGDN